MFEIDDPRQTFVLEKLAHIRGKLEKAGQEVMYSSKLSTLTIRKLLLVTHVKN